MTILQKITDFDIFAKKVGNYYNLKEKISSYSSFILTFAYIIFSLIIFFVYAIMVIKKIDYRINESIYFSEEIPEINVNNKLLYFAFGVEDPINTNTIVDESIYNIKVEYFDRIRKNGTWTSRNHKNLTISKCDEKNSGLFYEKFLKNKHSNDSYCINDFNLTLAGGVTYDRLAYIKIKVYPCVNKSENNFFCKSQKEIDYYLSTGIFSILTKDTGFNSSDINDPTTPIFKDLYFTIGKNFMNQYIIKFDITEIQTDKGLFFNRINTEKYLKFNKGELNINLRDEREYYQGNHVAEIHIRLSESIRILKRNYIKMTDILSTVGGYMQLIYIIFILISLLPNKLNSEKIIVDSLFNFDLKNKKVIITLKYKNRLNYYPGIKYITNNNDINKVTLYNDNLCSYSSISNSPKIINSAENMPSTFFRYGLNHINVDLSNINEIKNKSDLINNKNNNKIIYDKNSIKINDNSKDVFSSNLIQSTYQINQRNIFESKNKAVQSYLVRNHKNIMNPTNIKTHLGNDNKQINNNLSLISKNQNIEEKIIKNVKFNFFEYLCFQKCSKNNINIILFDEASSFYKNQMDIINIFSIILLFKENMKKENKHILDNMLCEKIEFKLPSLADSIYLNEEF